MRIYERFVKRGIDILLSGIGIVVLGWLYGLTVLAIYIDDRGPVVFTQKRIVKGKTIFIGVKNLFVEVPKFEPQVAA